MKNLFLILSLFILVVLATSITSAVQQNQDTVVFKTGTSNVLAVPCFNNGTFCSGAALCNLTVTSSNGQFIVKESTMVNNISMQTYQMPTVNNSGNYKAVVTCIDAGNSGSNTFDIIYTPTGTQGKSTTILLIIGLAGVILLILGVTLKNPYFAFIGGASFLLIGVYTMIYGFADVADLYTRGFSSILIGLGLFFLIVAAYEWTIDDIFNKPSSDPSEWFE